MKKGFTIIEVSILFVVFLIVAFMMVPLSLDDTSQAKNILRWKNVQSDFENIFQTVVSQQKQENQSFSEAMDGVITGEVRGVTTPYKISYMNGRPVSDDYKFSTYNTTISNAILAIKMYKQPKGSLEGIMMYDVNGTLGPNVWGRDVFGFNIYADKFEPFCKSETFEVQQRDCSKTGTGLCCSNYYLVGGAFE